jgi:hypothetical protein
MVRVAWSIFASQLASDEMNTRITSGDLSFLAERLAVAPAKWKLEFNKERYRRLPLASCSASLFFLGFWASKTFLAVLHVQT